MTFQARLRLIDRWVRESRGAFPADGGRPFHRELAPVEIHPIGSEVQVRALRKALAQAHVDVAADFMLSRPRQSHAKILAVLCWPNVEHSQVCVFFDLDHFQSFEMRNGAQQRWTRLEGHRSLSRELGLRAPARLRERGYQEWSFDPLRQSAPHEGEVWILGD
jgi:Protein of unknown function (DUF3916)